MAVNSNNRQTNDEIQRKVDALTHRQQVETENERMIRRSILNEDQSGLNQPRSIADDPLDDYQIDENLDEQEPEQLGDDDDRNNQLSQDDIRRLQDQLNQEARGANKSNVSANRQQYAEQGGPAPKASRKALHGASEGRAASAAEGTTGRVAQVGGKAAQAGGRAAAAAGRGVAAAGRAIGTAAASVGRAIASLYVNPATAPWAWGITLAVMIITLVVVTATGLYGASAASPNGAGKSLTQVYDPLNDSLLLKNLMMLSDPTQFKNILDTNKNKLISDIDEFIGLLRTNKAGDSKATDTINKLENIKAQILAYNTPDAVKAKSIQDALLAAIKPWSITLNPNGVVFPAVGYGADDICNSWGSGGSHRGIDIGMPIGTVYHAATNGIVVYLVDDIANYGEGDSHYGSMEENHGFGNAIIVQIDGSANPALNGMAWEIHHLSPNTATVKVGDRVTQGQIIAQSGHNGSSSGPHIHFQIDKKVCSSEGYNGNHPCDMNDGLSSTVNPVDYLSWSK